MENYLNYEKTISFDGKTYNISVIVDNDVHVAHIIEEPGIIYQAKSEEEVIRKATPMLKMWKKHNNIWGMKNLKTKQFSFKPFGTSLRITLFTPYASKSWLWMWNRSKSINAFTIRLFGINVYWSERNAKEKLEKRIMERIG